MVKKDKQKAGQIGGTRRAEILPPDRRAKIARSAALARWGLRATHEGNFKEEFGIDVDCYVLDDQQRTAVVSQRGIGEALGFSSRGNAFSRFLATPSIADIAGADLRAKLENPLKFQSSLGGAEQPPETIYGFDVGLLIDLCNVIIEAEAKGVLGERHEPTAKRAHVIVDASAKSGIQALVYRLADCDPAAEAVIAAFKLHVQEEVGKYEQEFPRELYLQWYRLYGIPTPEHEQPWHFKYLTVNHIYYPLAKSSGKTSQLLRAHKAKGGERSKKLFSFLSEVGARALGRHLGRVQEMADSSSDRYTYERKIAHRFGGEQEFDLPVPPPNTEPTLPPPLGPLLEHTDAKEDA
jgi:P63C domain